MPDIFIRSGNFTISFDPEIWLDQCTLHKAKQLFKLAVNNHGLNKDAGLQCLDSITKNRVTSSEKTWNECCKAYRNGYVSTKFNSLITKKEMAAIESKNKKLLAAVKHSMAAYKRNQKIRQLFVDICLSKKG